MNYNEMKQIINDSIESKRLYKFSKEELKSLSKNERVVLISQIGYEPQYIDEGADITFAQHASGCYRRCIDKYDNYLEYDFDRDDTNVDDLAFDYHIIASRYLDNILKDAELLVMLDENKQNPLLLPLLKYNDEIIELRILIYEADEYAAGNIIPEARVTIYDDNDRDYSVTIDVDISSECEEEAEGIMICEWECFNNVA